MSCRTGTVKVHGQVFTRGADGLWRQGQWRTVSEIHHFLERIWKLERKIARTEAEQKEST